MLKNICFQNHHPNHYIVTIILGLMHQLPHREFNCCKCQEFFRILYTCAWDMEHFFILSFILISSFVLISSSHSHFILSFSFYPFILILSFHSHFTGSLEQRKTLMAADLNKEWFLIVASGSVTREYMSSLLLSCMCRDHKIQQVLIFICSQ